MNDVSKEEVERRAIEAARRLLTTPKPIRRENKRCDPKVARSDPSAKGRRLNKAPTTS